MKCEKHKKGSVHSTSEKNETDIGSRKSRGAMVNMFNLTRLLMVNCVWYVLSMTLFVFLCSLLPERDGAL